MSGILILSSQGFSSDIKLLFCTEWDGRKWQLAIIKKIINNDLHECWWWGCWRCQGLIMLSTKIRLLYRTNPRRNFYHPHETWYTPVNYNGSCGNNVVVHEVSLLHPAITLTFINCRTTTILAMCVQAVKPYMYCRTWAHKQCVAVWWAHSLFPNVWPYFTFKLISSCFFWCIDNTPILLVFRPPI